MITDRNGLFNLLISYLNEDIYSFRSNLSSEAEWNQAENIKIYKGHRQKSDLKDFILFGPQNNSEYVVTGSDWGKVIFWNKQTAEMMEPYLTVESDGTVNCLAAHPCDPVLATSGLDEDIKIWSFY